MAAARSLVHGGQYAVHDGDKTWTVLTGHKKGRGEGWGAAGGVSGWRIVLKGFPYLEVNANQSSSYLKTSRFEHLSPQEHKNEVISSSSLIRPRNLPPMTQHGQYRTLHVDDILKEHTLNSQSDV